MSATAGRIGGGKASESDDTDAPRHREPRPEAWHLYLVRTRDGAIYTGIATDVARRIAEHEGGGPRAAKSLRGKGPFELIYRAGLDNRRMALRVERAVKQLSRTEKTRIAAANPDAATLLCVLGLKP